LASLVELLLRRVISENPEELLTHAVALGVEPAVLETPENGSRGCGALGLPEYRVHVRTSQVRGGQADEHQGSVRDEYRGEASPHLRGEELRQGDVDVQ